MQSSLGLTFRQAIATVALMVAVPAAHAVEYTITYTDYSNVSHTATYDITITSTAIYNFPGVGVVSNTPWWGNELLAQAAATAVGYSLYTGNYWYNSGLGPSFAYSTFSNSGFATYVWTGAGAAGNYNEYGVGPFAIGTLVETAPGGGGSSVPDGAATLSLLGLAVASLVGTRRMFKRA